MRRNIKALLVVAAVALLIRFLILVNSSLTFYSDDAIYASLARFLLEGDFGHFFHPTWQPLFPAFSALIYKLAGSWETALRVVSIISGVALIFPLFILVRKFLSGAHALIFSAVITFFTPIFGASLFPLSDMLAALLVLGGMTSGVLALGSKNPHQLFILTAFLFGLGFLTRSEGSLFFFLTLGWTTLYLLYRLVKKKAPIKNLLLPPVMAGVFLLTISPYLLATRLQLGTWTLSHKFSAQVKQEHAFALRKNGTTWAQEVISIRSPNYKSAYFKGGIQHLMEYQDWFTWWFRQKLHGWINLFKTLFPIWSFPFMALGMLWGLRQHSWQIGYLLFLMLISIPVTIFSTPLVDPRYLLWTFPLFILFFYFGVETLLKDVTKISATALVIAVLTLAFPSFSWDALTHPMLYARQFTIAYSRPEIKKAGQWVRENSPKEIPQVAMRHEGVEFYAGGETIYIPQVPYKVFIEYLQKNEVDYLVAWVEELAAEPQLAKLLEENTNFPQLKEEVRFEENNRVLVIYTLRH